jgi:hypothetical protein
MYNGKKKPLNPVTFGIDSHAEAPDLVAREDDSMPSPGRSATVAPKNRPDPNPFMQELPREPIPGRSTLRRKRKLKREVLRKEA